MWYLGGEDSDEQLEDLSKKEAQDVEILSSQSQQSPTLTPQTPNKPLSPLSVPSLQVSPPSSPQIPPHVILNIPSAPQTPTFHQKFLKSLAKMTTSPQHVVEDQSDLFILHTSTEISPAGSKSSSRLNTPSSSRPATPTNITLTLLGEEERIKNRRAFTEFLRSHVCYDIMPASVKIVVLDTRLAIQSAFQALVENGIL